MKRLCANGFYVRDERQPMILVSWIEAFIFKGCKYSNDANEMMNLKKKNNTKCKQPPLDDPEIRAQLELQVEHVSAGHIF